MYTRIYQQGINIRKEGVYEIAAKTGFLFLIETKPLYQVLRCRVKNPDFHIVSRILFFAVSQSVNASLPFDTDSSRWERTSWCHDGDGTSAA